MQLIKPLEYTKPLYKKVLFLAGGISNCPDWQNETVRALFAEPITVCNPRRDGTLDPKDPLTAVPQIMWERYYITLSNVLMFWFPETSVCPIALYELGGAMERRKLSLSNQAQTIIVGCHPDYPRRLDLETQTALADSSRVIAYDLLSMIEQVRKMS